MNPTETAKILAICSVAYPQYPVTKESVGIYHDLLSDLDIVQVERAVRDLLKTSDRWLSVAAIRRRVAENENALAPNKAQAWAEVRDACSKYGRQNRPQFSHPAITECVQTIGWYEICVSTNLETLRSQFWKAYEEIVKLSDTFVLTEQGQLALTAGATRLRALEG